VVEIKDYRSAKAWAEDKPREVQVAFAARCALRALPTIATEQQPIRSEIALPIMRALLTSGWASQRPAPSAQDISVHRATHSAAHAVARHAASSATRSASAAVASAATVAAAGRASAAARAFSAAIRSVNSDAAMPFVLAASKDASDLDAEESASLIFSYRLWREGLIPEAAKSGLDALSSFWRKDQATWSFWQRWYEAMLEGHPLDWDLQREVALIPDEDWKKGPKHIARLIEEIEARFALKARIRELEDELSRASKDRFGIGGNDPPEAIENTPSIAKEFTIIWAPLQDLKSEVESSAPEPSRTARFLTLLAEALRQGLRWCASKADLMVDQSIKWAVPAIGTGYLAVNPDKLAAVIEAGKRWLSMIP
jgi:hypothetical protein